MTHFREHITPTSILRNVPASSRKQAYDHLANLAAKSSGLSKALIMSAMHLSEDNSLSGIGNGVALPHVQIPNLKKHMLFFMHIQHPIEFNSIDNQPVDLFCFLLSPEKDGPHHLRRLSRLSRLLRDPSFCRMMRNIKDIDELQNLFVDSQKQMLIAA